MKKDSFKMSIFILLVGGFIVKVLGLFIKIFFTRTVGVEGISLYTIALPTYSLLITLAIFALPTSISKLVSEKAYNNKYILTSSLFLVLVLESILVVIFYFSSPWIARNLLKQAAVSPILQAMALTLPFISLSSILKGYFLGKMKVAPNTISNIIEQLIRIIFLIFVLPSLIQKNVMAGIVSFILISILTEIVSCFVFSLFLPKHIPIHKEDFKPRFDIIKRILETSVPCVSSRFIGNIGFFLEPIILTNLLLWRGFSNTYILQEYAAYNAYAIGLLTMPSFFIAAIDQILIPEISKHYAKKDFIRLKKRLSQALWYSFVIGLFFSVFICLFREHLLYALYKTNMGSSYILILAPFFVLFYLEAPLISTMQGIGKANISFRISFLAIVIKLLVMSLLCLCKFGLYSLVIAEIVDIMVVVLLEAHFLKKYLQ